MKNWVARVVTASVVAGCLVMGASKSSHAWTRPDADVITFGGAGEDSVRGMVVDGYDNVYVSGYFEGTVDFAPGVATTNIATAGDRDGYLAKYSSSGTLVWVKTFGGTDNDSLDGVALDATGNIYVTGSFQGTADIDPGVGDVSVTSAGYSDGYVMKLNPSGEYVWHRTISAWTSEGFGDVKIDSSGNVLVLGMIQTSSSLEDGSGGPTTVAPSAGTNSWDGIVAQFSSSGLLQWTAILGGAQDDWFRTLAIDTNDAVIVGGNFTGSLDADPTGGVTSVTGTGQYNGVVVKLSSLGGLVWAKVFDSTFENSVHDIEVGPSNAIYVAGNFWDTTDLDPGVGEISANATVTGSSDSFLVKLESTGNYAWSRTFGTGADSDSVDAMMSTPNGVVLVGVYRDVQDLDPGPATVTADAPGWRDPYVLSLNHDGSTQSVRTYGGSNNEDQWAVVPTSDGGMLIGGQFGGEPDFLIGSDTARVSSNGDLDAFVLKISSNGTSGTPTTTTTSTTVPVVAPSSSSHSAVTTTSVVTTRIQPVLSRLKSPTLLSIATFAGLTVPRGSKVSAAVRASSAKVCAIQNQRIRGKKKGSCSVSITVTSVVKGKKKTAKASVKLVVS